MSAARIALLSLLLGVSAALAIPARTVAQEGQGAPGVSVAVQNRFAGAVRVYAFQDGHMVPLGLVDSSGNGTFSLPPGFRTSDPIQVLADPLSSTDWYKSDALSVRKGSRVHFTIAKQLDSSKASVSH